VKTFSIQVLGCKVNQYEAEQIAGALREQGLVPAGQGEPADLRVIHTCSVTAEAGKKSAQTIRRMTRLPILQPKPSPTGAASILPVSETLPPPTTSLSARTVVTGCWATSHPAEAAAVAGVDAVITNAQDVNTRLAELVTAWTQPAIRASINDTILDGRSSAAARALPLFADRHPRARESANQRAFLKIQDGCDAFCTYCIIPQLRPRLWSKPIDACVAEAQALVDRGHAEIVLTGIFLGAYGFPTALRRRQTSTPSTARNPETAPVATGKRSHPSPLANLVDALCQRTIGLKRLRLSSLEPGDLDADLIAVLRSHEQAVPHFHLPLQSGSDAILRKMNRQYRRDDFLRMIDEVNQAFDRPAITTDIIVGFPGETDEEFAQTLEIARRVGFIHAHAFSYSPRPGTAAARWTQDFVPPRVANARIKQLTALADDASLTFRQGFMGEVVEILVERDKPGATTLHGRCERYFDVQFPATAAIPAGSAVRLRVNRVSRAETLGEPVTADDLSSI